MSISKRDLTQFIKQPRHTKKQNKQTKKQYQNEEKSRSLDFKDRLFINRVFHSRGDSQENCASCNQYLYRYLYHDDQNGEE